MTDTKALEKAIRYYIKLGYSYGYTSKIYDDNFAKNFDFKFGDVQHSDTIAATISHDAVTLSREDISQIMGHIKKARNFQIGNEIDRCVGPIITILEKHGE